jgi:hypothetical protein
MILKRRKQSMKQEQLNKIVENHQHYLNKDIDGWENMRADLSNKILYEANLRRADLRNADFREASLFGADLRYANLSGADLRDANLCKANLRGANLRGVKLQNTDIVCAVISEDTKIDYPIACPETGSFIGYKKAVSEKIVKLQICKDAKRSSATTKKCRCSKALVLAIENIDGSDSGLQEIKSIYNHCFIYRVGEIAEVPDFDDNRWNECAPGLHFFVDRQDAVEYEF